MPFVLILSLLAQLNSLAQDQRTIDSLNTLLQKATEDTLKAEIMYELAWTYMYSNPETAFAMAQKQFVYGQAAAASSDSLTSKTGKKFMAYALVTQAVNSRHLGNYPQALEYNFRALKILDEIDAQRAATSVYNNIGNVYSDQGDLESALTYFDKALILSEELGNKMTITAANMNVGMVYDLMEQHNKALEYYFKSLELAQDLGNKRKLANVLGNIGSLYDEEEKHELALEYYDKELALRIELGDEFELAATYVNIGSMYSATDNPKAEDVLLNALNMAQKSGGLYIESYAHEALAKHHVKQGDYENALKSFQLYSQARDSLFNEDKSKEIGRLEAKFEFEKIEEEKKRAAETEAARRAEQEKRRNNLQYSGIFILLVVLSVGILALGRLAVPERLAEGMIFFSFLLFFEFTLVLLDPFIEQYSGGAPAYKLMFNAVLAALIFPLHSFFEERLKSKTAF